jgi:hypothetical protein
LPVVDLNFREKAILVESLIVPVFWLGLAPGEALRKTELAARQYQQLIAGEHGLPARTAAVPTIGGVR